MTGIVSLQVDVFTPFFNQAAQAGNRQGLFVLPVTQKKKIFIRILFGFQQIPARARSERKNTDPYNFTPEILKDLKEIYEKGSIRKKARLLKSPGIIHLVNDTGELIEAGNKLVGSPDYRSFYD